MPKRISLFALFSLVLFLTACQQSAEPTPIPPVDANGNISVAASQFISLRFLMADRDFGGMELAKAQSLYMETLLIEDINGQNSDYWTLVSPVPIGNPYEFVLSIDSDERQEDSERIWAMTMGAKDIYYVFTSATNPPLVFIDLARTVQSIGGEDNLKRLVAVPSSSFYVETTEGIFIGIRDGQMVSIEEIQEDTQDYYNRLTDSSAFSRNSQEWLCQFDRSECAIRFPPLDPKPYNFDIAALTKADGTLDIPAAAAEIQRQLIDP
ncbi:MAG: hypothetical protein AAF267_15080 [Deinococcota bacterium]